MWTQFIAYSKKLEIIIRGIQSSEIKQNLMWVTTENIK